MTMAQAMDAAREKHFKHLDAEFPGWRGVLTDAEMSQVVRDFDARFEEEAAVEHERCMGIVRVFFTEDGKPRLPSHQMKLLWASLNKGSTAAEAALEIIESDERRASQGPLQALSRKGAEVLQRQAEQREPTEEELAARAIELHREMGTLE